MITLQLPWPHTVIAFIRDDDTYLVVAERDKRPHPYTLHRCNEQGECFYGHYFNTKIIALQSFCRLAKLDGVGEDERTALIDQFLRDEGYDEEVISGLLFTENR